MKKKYPFFRQISSIIILSMGLGLISLTPTFSLTNQEIDALARKFTVIIDGPLKGTGIIIHKENNDYVVLTNCHVIKKKGKYTIKTVDNKIYEGEILGCLKEGKIDLGILQFTSNKKYELAVLDQNLPNASDKIYIGGWQAPDKRCSERCYNFIPGEVFRDAVSTPEQKDGYNLLYQVSLSKIGMSGSGILNVQGKVIGIHSAVEKDESTNQSYNLGVPIQFFCNAIDKSLAGVCQPQTQFPPNTISSSTSTPTLTPTPTPKPTPTPTPKPIPKPIPKPTPTPKSTSPIARNTPVEKSTNSGILSMAISKNNQMIVTGDDHNDIIFWDNNKQIIHTIKNAHNNWITSLVINEKKGILISGSGDKTIKIWDLKTHKFIRKLDSDIWINALAISNNGQFLASAGDGNDITIWNVETGLKLHTLKGHSKWINTLAFSELAFRETKVTILASGSDDKKIKIWIVNADPTRSGIMSSFRDEFQHNQNINTLVFTNNGDLISGSDDQTIKIWDVSNSTLKRTLEGHNAPIQSLVMIGNNQFASSSNDNTVKIWYIDNNQAIQTIPNQNIYSLQFLEGKNMLVSGSDQGKINLFSPF